MGDVPVQVEITPWDPESDGVIVKHDGEIVWTEQSMGYFDQYLKFYAPQGIPVILTVIET